MYGDDEHEALDEVFAHNEDMVVFYQQVLEGREERRKKGGRQGEEGLVRQMTAMHLQRQSA